MTTSALLIQLARPETERTALVVDLDGTLVRTDTLLEALLVQITRPWCLLRAFLALRHGMARFKQAVAESADLDPALLPYNQELLGYLREEQKAGRTLILATAADRRIAAGVAQHLDLFDTVLASDGTVNLKGPAKLAAIWQALGDQPFCYAGDSRADLAVWGEADSVILANAGAGLTRAAGQLAPIERSFAPSMPWPAALLRGLRLHQWVKNLLVFVPILTARGIDDVSAWLNALVMFFAFSLCASGIYLINDLCDLAADRQHPKKRERALASGALSLQLALSTAPFLMLCGAVLSAATGTLPILICYALTSLSYSVFFKSWPLVDVFLLAGLYTIRLVGGGAAAGSRYQVSLWLLAFSCFLFLSLALVKRVAELQGLSDKRRIAGRGYRAGDVHILQMMGIGASFVSALILALYAQAQHVIGFSQQPTLAWAIVPLVLFWQCRIWLATARGRMHHDPIVFAAGDWVSWLVAACAFAALLFGNRITIIGT